MPAHDWTRVDAGLFHAFHQRWLGSISDVLNSGVLPSDYFALQEQRVGGPIPHVLTLQLQDEEGEREERGGLAIATVPPQASIVRRSDASIYAEKADRIIVRHSGGKVVAVIEIVSPGNKASRNELLAFVNKSAEFLALGVHLMVVDLFPPGPRDPGGIHKAIWDEVVEEEFAIPREKPLTAVSYYAGPEKVAYIEPFAVGDPLPSNLPLFLIADEYVKLPLEASYEATWKVYPAAIRRLLT